jgi:hypothetical protein
MRWRTTMILAGFLVVGAASSAGAEPKLLHPWGMSLSAGGGVNDFAGEDLRDITGTGGAWDARFAFGTRQYVGIEAAYLGTAQSIDAIGMEEDAVLLSNGVEADVRFNALKGDFQPYVFAGAAWKRYDLTNTDTNTSDVNDQDDVLEVPVGCGIGYNYRGVIFDARASYRFAAEEDLLPASDGDGASTLDNFNVAAHVGIEF